MKNKNQEYNDFESFKRKAQTEDNYYLTENDIIGKVKVKEDV